MFTIFTNKHLQIVAKCNLSQFVSNPFVMNFSSIQILLNTQEDIIKTKTKALMPTLVHLKYLPTRLFFPTLILSHS